MSKELYVVGIGPGERSKMTIEADEILRRSEVIIGYNLYVELVEQHYPQAEFLTTGMRKERERCLLALKTANEDKTTSVVCSGDSGVYGMAGLIYEMSVDFPEVAIKVIPGVTAALSGGAVLGSPLGHDFCCISLSDLMTPWELIEKRLRLAGEADLAIALYNPSSKKRNDYLEKAAKILLESRSGDTVCGYVRNIGREGEEFGVMTLSEMVHFQADMLMTMYIGNSQTRVINGQMVTPRGYIEKYGELREN